MRKFAMLMFVMMIVASVMAVPAFAQGTAAAAGTTNWVALTSGFAIALAAGLAALGQGKWRGGLRCLGTQSGSSSWHQVALILGLAFIESLVLFTLVIIFVKVA